MDDKLLLYIIFGVMVFVIAVAVTLGAMIGHYKITEYCIQDEPNREAMMRKVRYLVFLIVPMFIAEFLLYAIEYAFVGFGIEIMVCLALLVAEIRILGKKHHFCIITLWGLFMYLIFSGMFIKYVFPILYKEVLLYE